METSGLGAGIYAQWGNVANSREWSADPVRNEPRVKAVERELKFPD